MNTTNNNNIDSEYYSPENKSVNTATATNSIPYFTENSIIFHNSIDNFYTRTDRLLKEAFEFLKKELDSGKYNKNKICFVFDIDQTIVHLNEMPNKKVIEFYKYLADTNNFPIYIITSRINNPDVIKRTTDMLIKYGLFYTKIFFRNESEKDISFYKNNIRKSITKELDKTILMAFGDMCWDINTYVLYPVHIPVLSDYTNLNNPSYYFKPCEHTFIPQYNNSVNYTKIPYLQNSNQHITPSTTPPITPVFSPILTPKNYSIYQPLNQSFNHNQSLFQYPYTTSVGQSFNQNQFQQSLTNISQPLTQNNQNQFQQPYIQILNNQLQFKQNQNQTQSYITPMPVLDINK
jgi:hypothetical protein